MTAVDSCGFIDPFVLTIMYLDLFIMKFDLFMFLFYTRRHTSYQLFPITSRNHDRSSKWKYVN